MSVINTIPRDELDLLIFKSKLLPTEKLLLLLFSRLSHENKSFPSIQLSLASVRNYANFARDTLNDRLKNLEKIGWIKIKRKQKLDGSKGKNTYTICQPPSDIIQTCIQGE